MFDSAYKFKDFYSSKAGRLVRRLVTGHLREIWPDVKGQSLMGYGYSVPYLKPFMAETERALAVMPDTMGVHSWPLHRDSLVCLGRENSLPFASASLDRVLLLHGLEYSTEPALLLGEIWRVLKSNGRLIVIVPNRLGLWSRADWTPFGYGTPYTAGQITRLLSDCMFVPETVDHALFMPPFKSFLVLRAAYTMEGFGQFVFPGLAGLHVVEAGKQIYAGVTRSRQTSREKIRKFAVGETVPTG